MVSGTQHFQKSVRSKGEKLTHFIHPMLAQLGDHPFDDPGWLFEIKWDGYRAVAEVGKKSVRLYSRNGLSFLQLYPSVAKALEKIKVEAVLDGEIVVMDKDNKPSFQKLQHYSMNQSLPLIYYVFDCLSYKGKDLTSLPLTERKKILQKILPAKDNIVRYSDHVSENGKDFFHNVVAIGLEGMIAKRAESLYTKGKRTGEWLKIKNHNTQEAVIAGYTAPRGSRKYFGALVLGMYERGHLKYIGHTGTGFTEKLLKELHYELKPLAIKASPFDQKIPINAPVTWVKPVKVCNVKFTEITNDGILRHPVFMGLRIDKAAKEVDHLDVSSKAPSKKASKTKKAKSDVGEGIQLTKVDGHSLKLTNQQKVYWPKEGITKGDVLEYYNTIAKYILPYLKDRPQSLKRNPNGITDKGFFHKDAGEAAPSWVKHIKLYSESAEKDIDYILCNNKATLLYLNNLGCIEINPWNSRIKNLDKPDYLVMDIDPSDKNSFDEVIETAQVIKEILDKAQAQSFCKTSGATGLHVYVPLRAAYSYDQARAFAEIVARLTHEQLPSFTSIERSLNKRKSRIYIDYLQNKRGQTLSSVYSLRPVPGACVSTPLTWREVKPGLHPSQFTISTISKRLSRKGDLFGDVITERLNLRRALKNLEG